MRDTSRGTAETNGESEYTVYTVCRYCGQDKREKRPQSSFCSDRCRYDFHNKRAAGKSRRRTPPVAADEAGQKLYRIRHRKRALLLTVTEYETAARRAEEAEARVLRFNPAAHLTVRAVLAALHFSRARLYQLIDVGRFPRATVVYPPGAGRGKRIACWCAADVRAFIERRTRPREPIALCKPLKYATY